MGYVLARYKAEAKETSYKAYVTDILYSLAMRQGIDVSMRWYDIIEDNTDSRTEAEKALENFYSDVR